MADFDFVNVDKVRDRSQYDWGGSAGAADTAAQSLYGKSKEAFDWQKQSDARAREARTEQQAQIDRLGRIARGEQASPAETQLREQNRQGQALMTSQAVGARGGFAQAMAAQRAAAMGQAASSQNLVGQAGQVRAQAQMQAQDQLADALAQQRTQDYAQRAAALQGGVDATNSNLDLTAAQNRMNMAFADLDKRSAAEVQRFKDEQFQQQLLRERREQQQNRENLAMGIQTVGTIAGVANIAGGSDRRIKRDIKNGEPAARGLMDALAAHTFRYKDEADAPRRLGVMAQDLERTPEGRAIVVETPRGKAIDTAAGLGAALAGLADINRRLKRLEKR